MHHRYLLVLISLGLFPLCASFAQDDSQTGWELATDINLTQTQNAYSDNWESDEAGSFAWIFTLNSIAEKQLSDLLNSRNTLKLKFGQTQNQTSGERNWTEPQKSDDLVDFESVWRMTFDLAVDPFVSGRVLTQFYDSRGEENVYLNPVTYSEAVGIARDLWRNKEGKTWLNRVGVGFRQHVDHNVLLDETTGKRGRMTGQDSGLEFVSEMTTPLIPDKIKMDSKLIAFKAFYYSEADEAGNQYWKEVDLSLESTVTMNVTRYIMVNLYAKWLYDKELDLAGRFKETVSLGFTYSF